MIGRNALGRRTRLWGSVALLLILLIPPGLNPSDEEGLRELGRWLDMPANVAQADALVVMGGDSRQRLVPAIELFQQGFAPELWYTGGSVPVDWTVDWTVNRAVSMGVAPELITHLAGNSTWEDTQQIAHAFEERGLHSVLIVTSWYHGRRTLCVLRHHLQESNVQVYYQPVGYEEYGPENWWLSEVGRKTVLSELTKFGYYWLTYGLSVQDC